MRARQPGFLPSWRGLRQASAPALEAVLAKALAVVAGGDRAALSVTGQCPLCTGVTG